VTGPYLEADDGADLRARVADLSWLELHSYVSGLPAWMSACDLFLGGRLTPVLAQALAEPLRPGPGVALNGARQYPRLLAELLR
jgi:hypothetical protein